MNKLSVAAVLAFFCSIAAAHAESVLASYLGAPGDCYFRHFDSSYLQSHIEQRLKTILVSHYEGYQSEETELVLFVQFTSRDGTQYGGGVTCSGVVCGSADEELFSLLPYGDGLMLKQHPLWDESTPDYIKAATVREFVIYREPAHVCAH